MKVVCNKASGRCDDLDCLHKFPHEFCHRCDQENYCERNDERIAVECVPVNAKMTKIEEPTNKLKVVDYKILRCYESELLENSVIGHLKDGYKLQGGVSCNMYGEYLYYCQAVVKYE